MKIVITKKCGEKLLFNSQDFFFEDGKITCLLGESGIGKTTLLHALAGIEPFDGKREGVGSVAVAFQEPRLLPFKSALGNMTFVGIDEKRGAQWLDWAEIADKKQKASTLSGGEKQRVSLARAVAKESDVLLLDEPFASVDTARKVRLLKKLSETLAQQQRTCVFVTHDVDEAVFIADEILLWQQGELTRFAVQEKDREKFGDSPLRQKIYDKILSVD